MYDSYLFSTIAPFKFLLPLSPHYLIFLVNIMAFNFTPEELAQFHAYIQQGRSLTPSAPNSALAAPNPHPPVFQPTQVPSSQAGPLTSTPLPSFQQQTPSQVYAQPSISVIQPAFQLTQVPSSGPPPTSQPLPRFPQQTQVQPQPSTIQPPPVSQLYQNTRPHQPGHSATINSHPGPSFNPFLGGAALSLLTAHANQAHLASALSSIPQNPTLP